MSQMPDYQVLHLPQEAPNDEAAFLIEWCAEDGRYVSKDQILAKFESSKAIFELYAPDAGYLFHLESAGRDLPIGVPIGLLARDPVRPTEFARQPEGQTSMPLSASSEGTPTRKARELMDRHGLTALQFPGIDFIREQHVLRYLKLHAPGHPDHVPSKLVPLSPRQRRVVEAVSTSQQSIPHSFLSLAIDAARATERVASICQQTDAMVSITDLLVYAVSRVAPNYPKANACFEAGQVRLYDQINVGLAMNLSNGDLLVPVVPNANVLSITEIAARLRGLQIRALRDRLTVEDLSHGTVTATSLIGTGVSQVWPIILPLQSVIFAVADVTCIGTSSVYFLTIAFDHRILNGSEAGNCLRLTAEILMKGDLNG